MDVRLLLIRRSSGPHWACLVWFQISLHIWSRSIHRPWAIGSKIVSPCVNYIAEWELNHNVIPLLLNVEVYLIITLDWLINAKNKGPDQTKYTFW